MTDHGDLRSSDDGERDLIREALREALEQSTTGKPDADPRPISESTISKGRASASDSVFTGVVPRQLHSVRLLHEIGRGGMGAVWLGRDELLARDVAVKFLLDVPAGPDDPDFARFLSGARAAARVLHPGLTTIFQADLFEGIPYLVMQYIDGPSLAAVLRSAGRLTAFAALAAITSVTEAIAALHEQSIIHRDIKPQNILLDRQGRLFVTDFGLASLLRFSAPRGASGGLAAADVPSALAAWQTACAGTAPYMAPEMFDGEVSTRSDVYALGITLFELLTGELPFRGTFEELRRRHQDEPLPLHRLSEDVPAAITEIIERAVHKNALYRHKSAAQLLRALKDAAPDGEFRSRGASELAELGARYGALPGAPSERPPTELKTPGYYEHLATKAGSKREMPRARSPRPSGTSTPQRTAPPEMTYRLRASLPCVRCGYDLRRRTSDDLCPECGTPLTITFRDSLYFADTLWLRLVAAGTMLCGAGPLGHFAAGLIAIVAAFWVPPIADALDQGMTLLFSGLAAVGVVLTTTPENRKHAERPSALLRYAAAFLALGGLLTAFVVGDSFRYGHLGTLGVYISVALTALRVSQLVQRVPAASTACWGRRSGGLSLLLFAVACVAHTGRELGAFASEFAVLAWYSIAFLAFCAACLMLVREGLVLQSVATAHKRLGGMRRAVRGLPCKGALAASPSRPECRSADTAIQSDQ